MDDNYDNDDNDVNDNNDDNDNNDEDANLHKGDQSNAPLESEPGGIQGGH